MRSTWANSGSTRTPEHVSAHATRYEQHPPERISSKITTVLPQRALTATCTRRRQARPEAHDETSGDHRRARLPDIGLVMLCGLASRPTSHEKTPTARLAGRLSPSRGRAFRAREVRGSISCTPAP